jgi:ribonucleotide monophosphatase NagD (HAD superfamily)
VIVRGKKVLPSALESFKKLIDSDGRFRIPTVFVTNAGNALRHEKAEQLSCWLEIEVLINLYFPCLFFHFYIY